MKGCEVDMVTGRPVMERLANAKGMTDDRAAQLAATASMAEAIRSPGGLKLLDLVFERFVNRVHELVQADPKASAFVEIFAALNRADYSARRAADALAETYRLPMGKGVR